MVDLPPPAPSGECWIRRISIGVVINPLLILPSTVAPTLREEAEIAFLMRLIEVADLQKPIIFDSRLPQPCSTCFQCIDPLRARGGNSAYYAESSRSECIWPRAPLIPQRVMLRFPAGPTVKSKAVTRITIMPFGVAVCINDKSLVRNVCS
jgi:hypothetical protein